MFSCSFFIFSSVTIPGLLMATIKYDKGVRPQTISVAIVRQLFSVFESINQVIQKLEIKKAMNVGKKQKSRIKECHTVRPKSNQKYSIIKYNVISIFFPWLLVLGFVNAFVHFISSSCCVFALFLEFVNVVLSLVPAHLDLQIVKSNIYKSYNTIYSRQIYQSQMSKGNSGSETKYWQHAFKQATKIDLGHICKECKKPFTCINEELAIRRGGRIELKYHIKCFSGYSDPRTQQNSSFNASKWAGTQQIHAPKQIYKKMRTGSHF